jgi:hypothetical protein
MPDITTDITWGVSSSGLQLGLRAAETLIEIYLRNTGDATLSVASHVLANETQWDWITLHVTNTAGHTRAIRLLDDRDESGLITARVQPGGWLQHAIDLPRWAARAVNGAQTLTAGDYQVRAMYTVPEGESDDERLWIGQLEAGPIAYAIAP